MIHSNIIIGKNVQISHNASLNNVRIGDNVLIGENATIFGSPKNILEIGKETVIGSKVILNGFAKQLTIGEKCSIGSFCHFLVDSGPTASPLLLKKYGIAEKPIEIGDECVIGHGTMVTVGVTMGDCVHVLPNSFVNKDIPSYSVVGGCPAKLIRTIDPSEL